MSSTRARVSGGNDDARRSSSERRTCSEVLTEPTTVEHRVSRSATTVELVDFLVDDGFGARDFAGTSRKILANRRLLGRRCCRGTPARCRRLTLRRRFWHRDVDEEQADGCAVDAHCLDMRPGQHRRRCTPVAVMTMSARPRARRVPSTAAAPPMASAVRYRVRHRAADDRDLRHALRFMCRGGANTHFAGADDEGRSGPSGHQDLLGKARRPRSSPTCASQAPSQLRTRLPTPKGRETNGSAVPAVCAAPAAVNAPLDLSEICGSPTTSESEPRH